MVIDSNMLRSDGLRTYLSRSPRNFALLPDYASMEAYKGDTLVSIYKSMDILSQFPGQVLILKNTLIVCGLRTDGAGLQRRLIDEDQTKGFPDFCQHLARAKAGDKNLQRQLLELGQAADKQMNRMLAEAEGTREAIEAFSKTYTNEERKILRERDAYTDEMIRKLFANVLLVARKILETHPNVKRLPPRKTLPNSFIFRSALCGYLMALEWVRVGGASGANPERLRNDLVDISFAAYGTYFDGLMSSDKRVLTIYHLAARVLSMIKGYR